MIQKFVDRFNERRGRLEAIFTRKIPACYEDLVKLVIGELHSEENDIHPEHIHMLTFGDYQGTMLFVIGTKWDDNRQWFVKVFYGSCSGCDTLQAIHDDDDDWQDAYSQPNDRQVKDCMTLALHIVQGLKAMQD